MKDRHTERKKDVKTESQKREREKERKKTER
jgi:hypothetical protein